MRYDGLKIDDDLPCTSDRLRKFEKFTRTECWRHPSAASRSSRQPASDLHLSQLVNGQANRFGKRPIMNEYATPPLKEQLRRYPS